MTQKEDGDIQPRWPCCQVTQLHIRGRQRLISIRGAQTRNVRWTNQLNKFTWTKHVAPVWSLWQKKKTLAECGCQIPNPSRSILTVCLSGDACTQPVKHRGSTPAQRKAFITHTTPHIYSDTYGSWRLSVCVCVFASVPAAPAAKTDQKLSIRVKDGVNILFCFHKKTALALTSAATWTSLFYFCRESVSASRWTLRCLYQYDSFSPLHHRRTWLISVCGCNWWYKLSDVIGENPDVLPW